MHTTPPPTFAKETLAEEYRLRERRSIARRAALALALAALLLPLLAVPAGAENGEPCQVWVDAVAVHEARQDANSDYPQAHIDRAEAALLACTQASNGQDGFYHTTSGAGFAPGDRTDGRDSTPAEATANEVRSFTYSPIENPYRGWDVCHGETGSNCGPRNQYIQLGIIRPGGQGADNVQPPVTVEQAEKQAEAEARIEEREGAIDWYRPPIGTGENGEIRVPCAANGNKLQRDPNWHKTNNNPDGTAKAPWIDSGSAPGTGHTCF